MGNMRRPKKKDKSKNKKKAVREMMKFIDGSEIEETRKEDLH